MANATSAHLALDAHTDWRDVDSTGDRGGHSAYLDHVAAAAPYKLSTYETLRLRRGDEVLDVGCGTGDDVRALAEIVGPQGRAVGLDSSRTLLDEARSRVVDPSLAVEYVVGSAYDLPFDDDSFDAARADWVFQHLDDHPRALAEMIRVVRPGGRISVCDPDWESGFFDTGLRDIGRRIIQHWVDSHPNGHMGRQLYRLCMGAGLQDIQVLPCTLVFTDVEIAPGIADFVRWGEQALEAGVVSAGELRDWRREFEIAAETGIFFAGGTLFCVTGTKPAVTRQEPRNEC